MPPSLCTQAETPHALPSSLLLCLDGNKGFAGGNNAALCILLQRTNCTSFWLLNNDTEPSPDALDALCARLNARPDAGICGSTLFFTHAPDTLQAAGGCTCSRWTGRTAFLSGGRTRTEVEALSPTEVERLERRMDFVVGASCLVRREVFEQAGLLPEEYFLYYEDVAFSLNAARAGFALAWAQDSVVMHKEGGSTHAQGERYGQKVSRPVYVDYLSIRNRIALLRRYRPWALPVALLSLLGVYINRLRRRQADRLSLILRAAWDGLTGRMGPPPASL